MTDRRTLAPERFSDFYRELHGREPYLWQQRAAGELASGWIWPALFAPTGAGKTTLIECFLFALACTADAGEDKLPLRLFWVIDRRSMVDQVCDHARRVVEGIDPHKGGTVSAVHARLAALATNEHGDSSTDAVQVRLWRGGLTGEAVGDGHAPLSPCTPAIICTTVDGVGSRMLFRGYGVANSSRPIEAALTSTDSLIVLDEAHLSGPFRDTAGAIIRAQESAVEQAIRPLHLLRISATLEDPPEGTFKLTAEELSEPGLARRLNTSKPVELHASKNQVRRCTDEARRLARNGAKVIAVVVNTVASARTIHTALRNYGDAILLIGPVRPLDRRGLLQRIPSRKERAHLESPLFVVGTQTIEVGVDVDFDALVSACAPFASLVQRFGRLDRRGDMEDAGRGVIVEPPSTCPVYGDVTAQTWEWLLETAAGKPLDLGPAAIQRLCNQSPAPDPPAQPQAPILGPWHLELLTQTSHDPEPDPDVAVFLHGEQALDIAADVQICWRADLNHEGNDRMERMQVRPPHAGELLSVSLGAARRWLEEQAHAEDLPDVESGWMSPHRRTSGDSNQGRWALRVRPPRTDGTIEVQEIHAAELRPGDVIAVPTSYGGCDQFGWAPQSPQAVQDLGNLATGQPRILLPGSPEAAKRLGVPEELRHIAQDTLERINSEELDEEQAYDELLVDITSWLENGGGFASNSPLARQATELGTQLETASGTLTNRRRRALAVGTWIDGKNPPSDLLIVAPTSACARSCSKLVLYETHVGQVAKRARHFAQRLGLSAELVATIDLAARNHDAGKLDQRFQAWLNGGMPPDGTQPLAKSGRDPGEQRSREAQEVAGWPQGKRHESLSAKLLATVEEWPPSIVRDLLIHLVLTHHGDGRPLRTTADDPDPVEVTAQIAINPCDDSCIEKTVMSNSEIPWSEHAERFIALNERFGPWGLAALEAILVLSDRGVSAEEGQ